MDYFLSLMEILIFCVTIVFCGVVYIKWKLNYWNGKTLPHLKPKFLLGNMESPTTRKHHLGEWYQMMYNDFKIKGHQHGGFHIFLDTAYMPIDPTFIKNVMQKDFQHFIDRGIYHNEKDDPLSAHLFAIGGQKWRTLRTKLTPTFTSGKMKMMFDILNKCGEQLEETIDDFSVTKQPVDIKDIAACFTTDVIGSCAFGLECNSFKNPNSEFRKYGKKVFQSNSKLRTVVNAFTETVPDLARKLSMRKFSVETTHFFLNVIQDTIKYRETNNVDRKDMMQILINLKNDNKADNLTIEEIGAQAFVFFIAGFETSSTTMSFILYELAANTDIQNKVREELHEVLSKHNGKLSYEALMELKYMDQVIDETLRKYPPLAFVTRKCVKNYQVPNTDVIIEEGTTVVVPIFGIQRDPEFFSNPDEFNPERFSQDNKKDLIPFTYLPFGEGPRICIGQRFGIMQTKVGLSFLLKNYTFSVNKQTITPFEWDPFSFILTSKGGIWLDVHKAKTVGDDL